MRERDEQPLESALVRGEMVSSFKACFSGGGERARRRADEDPASSLPKLTRVRSREQQRNDNYVYTLLKSTVDDVLKDVLKDILPDLLRDLLEDLLPSLVKDILSEILPSILKEILEEILPPILKQILKDTAGSVVRETLRPRILKDLVLPSPTEILGSFARSSKTDASSPDTQDSDEDALQAELDLAESLSHYMSQKRFKARSKSRERGRSGGDRHVSFASDMTSPSSPLTRPVRDLSRSSSGDLTSGSSRGLWYSDPMDASGRLLGHMPERSRFFFLWALAPFALWWWFIGRYS